MKQAFVDFSENSYFFVKLALHLLDGFMYLRGTISLVLRATNHNHCVVRSHDMHTEKVCRKISRLGSSVIGERCLELP